MTQYSTAVKILPDPLRSINSAAFTGVYQAIGAPLDRPIRYFSFANHSNVAITISWDGVHDHDFLLADSQNFLPITFLQSNVQGSQGIYVAKGTQFYVKGAAGVGSVYLTCIG